LLLALPRSLMAVESALRGNSYADYVGRGRLWGSSSELWEATFKGVAYAAEALAAEARGLGVSVTEDATLLSVRTAFRNFGVITIVAHWRGPTISKEDITLSPSLISKRLLEDPDQLPTRLRRGMAPDWIAKLSSSEEISRSRLAELLDARLRGFPVLATPPDGARWHMDAVTLHHCNRTALDDWWPDAFRAGNRLELADGLHSANDIGRAIPDAWAGVADLSNCQSAQLVSAIKLYRPDRVVIANELEANPIGRMAALRSVYGLVVQRWNYVEARKRLADFILHGGREKEKP
jgi:hypothetical protein